MAKKHINFPDELTKRLKEEKELSGINANAIVIIAVNEYLKKKEKERKND